MESRGKQRLIWVGVLVGVMFNLFVNFNDYFLKKLNILLRKNIKVFNNNNN